MDPRLTKTAAEMTDEEFEATMALREQTAEQRKRLAMDLVKRAYMNPAHAQGLMQLAASPFVNHWMQRHGLFYSSGNRNLYDQQRDFRQRGEHWDAMAQAAQADRGTYERLIGGIANIAGAKPAPGTRARDLIRRAAGDVSKIAPYAMTFAPELWDRLHGSRGSAAALASKIYLAHRGTPDPVTNQMGYSPHTASEMATGVYNQLYGPKAPPNAAAGYSAGEIGDLYQSMVHRGLMGSKRPANPLDVAGNLRAMAGPMATLRGMSSSLQAQHALPGTVKTGAEADEEQKIRRKAPRRNYTAGAAYGLGGAALIGGAGLYGKHHLDRMPPSLLQLGEGLWKDPLKLDEFRRRWETAKGRGTFQSLQKSLSAGRDSLRQALLDDAPVGKGLSVRDLTFGAGQAKPGDVTLESTWEGSMGRLYNLATGHGYSHVGVVGGPKGQLVHQFGLGPAAQVLETAKARLRPANAFVRLRDQQTGSAPGDAATAAKLEQIYKTETPYNLRGAAGATVHEILPEADWLGKAFNPKTWQGLIKRVLPTSWVQSMGRRAAALRLTGEICSSMASKAKEAIRPGSAPGPDASPGDWLRHTGPGKPHRVDEVYVPEPMRNRQSLLNQHWDRLGPLVPRAALAAAAVGLGGYGLYKGFRHFFPKREKTKKRDEEKTASLAGTGYRGVGTVKTAATALRSRISVIPHPEGNGFQFLLSGKPLDVVSGSTTPTGFNIETTGKLADKFRGMGLGKKMYGDMARLAPQQTIRSHCSVSPAAQRVWEGMPGRGYKFRRNPSFLASSGSGNRLGVGSEPVYQASLPAAAGLPYRGDGGLQQPSFWRKLLSAVSSFAKTGSLIGTGYRGDQKTTVCPRCGDELQAKDIYTDKKNWSWCRRCFRQGAGRLHFKAGVAPPVPVRQRTNFDCGSAVVASLLGGLKPKDQDRLADELDTTPNDGAPPIRLVNTMRAAGLQVEEHHLMTLQALRRFIDRGRPVICPIQAWGDEANRHDGVAGHYVVVCGYDEKRQLLHFMDPAIGDFRSLSYPEFWTRWRDHAANGDHYLRYGIVAWNPRKLALPQPGGVQPGEFHKTSFAAATGGSGPETGQTQVTDPGPWQPGIEPVEEVDDKLVDESMAPPGEDFVEEPTLSPVSGLT